MTSDRRISSRFFGSGFFFIGLILVFGVGNHLVVRETEARSQRLPGIEGSVPVAINPLLTSRTMFPKLGNPLRQTPTIAATKVDALQNDVDGDFAADPGDRLRYTVVITNSGGGNATGVNFTDTIDANTTLVAGSVKVSPLAIADSYNAVGNTTLTINTASGVRANDYDVDGVTPTASLVVTAGTFATTQGGSVTIAADGSFTYEPQVGDQNLTDTFTYTLTDGDGLTDTGTVTINLGQRVWYVDSTASAGGNGTFASRFDSLADVSGATGPDTAGDIIYVFERTGDYDGNMTLLNNQQLIGSGVALTVNTITVVAAGSNTTLVATAASTNSITLGSGNTVRGFTIGNTTGAGISGNSIGTFNADTLTINGTGQILSLSNGTINATSGITLSTTSTTQTAVVLTSMAGSLTAGGSISGSNGCFTFGGTLSVTYSGSATNGGGNPLVNISAHSTGTITFQTGTLSSTSNGGLTFDNADGTYNFNGTTTLNGGGARLTIFNGSSGTFGFGSNTSITNPTNVAFEENGSNAAITYNGTVSSNTAFRLVDIASNTGGSVTLSGNLSGTGSSTGISVSSNTGGTYTFSGGTKTLNTGASTAVNLSSNTGATINFTGGGLDIDTTSGTGFTATGGGTVNVTGTGNSITSTTGTALNVQNTTVGTSTLNFQSISSSGGSATGIILVNTGVNPLVVTGNGATSPKGGNGTGGTITNKTGGADGDGTTSSGVYINNGSATLQHMNLTRFDNFGVYGLSVNNVTVQYCTVGAISGSACADADGDIGTSTGSQDAAIVFGKSLPGGLNGFNTTGTPSFLLDNLKVFCSIEHQIEVYQQSHSFSGTVSNSDITDNSTSGGSDGIQIETHTDGNAGTPPANATISIQNCFFDDNKSQGIQAAANGDSTIDITINNCRLQKSTQGNEGFLLSNGTDGDLVAHVTNNAISGVGGVAIFVGQTAGNATAASSLTAVIKDNTITHPTSATNHAIIAFLTSCGAGASPVCAAAAAPANILIDRNTVTENSTSGVARAILVDTPDTNALPTYTATVINNIVSVGDNVNGVTPIVVQARQASAGCFDVRNNTATFPNGVPGGQFGIRVRQANTATVNLEQGVSSGTAATVLAANNPGTTTEVLGTVTVVSNATCQTAPSRPATTSSNSGTHLTSPGKTLSLPEPKELNRRAVTKLTPDQVSWLTEAAIARWLAAGAPVEKIDQMRAVKFGLADLEKGDLLTQTPSTLVLLDAKAGGYGWYIDPSPMDDVEFEKIVSETELEAGQASPAHGKVDLLTVIMHQFGRALGLEVLDGEEHAHKLMSGRMAVGVRRVPGSGYEKTGIQLSDSWLRDSTMKVITASYWTGIGDRKELSSDSLNSPTWNPEPGTRNPVCSARGKR